MTKQKVLVVEDEQLVANVYRNTFLVEGFSVEVASDGKRALELVRDFKPDVLVLDLMIPELDGVEVISRLRASESTRGLPIVVCSNFYLSQMVEKAWKAGANYCLMKANCGRKQLVSVVRKALAPEAPRLTPAPPEPASESDEEFYARAEKMFFNSIPDTQAALRMLLHRFIKNETDRPERIRDLYQKIHALTGNSALMGFAELADFSSATEAFLNELQEKPDHINAATTRTLVQATEFLSILLDRVQVNESKNRRAFNVLVVDDDLVACKMITYSLQRARLHPTVVNDPLEALELAKQKKFDLIILDVNMPVMDGFELCTKLRALSLAEKVPILFITCMTDFESRAKSTLSGGNEFIPKPFLLMELTVKSLLYILKPHTNIAIPEPVAG